MSAIGAARPAVGILGVGTCLPPAVRTNDWWPPEVVARWTAGQTRAFEALAHAPPAGEAARAVAQAMIEVGVDPFGGVHERHVLADDATATDLEAALADAGVAAGDVDLLLVHTAVPEYLLSNTACVLHERLGLARGCRAFEVQASAYAFLAQLELAAPMIETGRARCALLVQSSAASRLIDPLDPFSARVGDAGTAVVVGRVTPGHGILASADRTDGRRPRTLIAGTPGGGRWYEGRSQLCVPDVEGAFRMFIDTVDQARDVIADALAAADVRPDQIDVFAVHQGTAWMRRLVQQHTGLARARTVDLFARIGYVFAASIPLVLHAAVADGALGADDLVLMMGGGTGMTYGATVMRWGGERSS